MGKESFFRLYDIVAPHMPNTGERDGGGVPNGPITKMSRLSMALRFSAGGDPADIGDHHGVNVGEVNNSLECVVDAMHMAPEPKIVSRRWSKSNRNLLMGSKQNLKLVSGCVLGRLMAFSFGSTSQVPLTWRESNLDQASSSVDARRSMG